MNTLEEIGIGAILVACKLPTTQERLDNVPHLFRAIEEHGITDPAQVAYILATVAHECTFRSIEEYRAQPGTEIRRMQDRYWSSGYYGRGFSQLTWEGNYRKFEQLLGIPLVAQPQLALTPAVGADILVLGMRDGIFSGKKLSDYILGEKRDYIRARRIVNGNFQADRVARHAIELYKLLA
jgi:predicted chitinase